MKKLYDLSFDELTAFVVSLGQPKFRGRQVWEWMYKKAVASFDEMTNLPLSLREELDKRAVLETAVVASEQLSTDKQTKKVLFKLTDGQYVETVFMGYRQRRTICISTQAGCSMGCVFCATGQMGFVRHLTVGEIIAQAVYFARELAANDSRITNIVLMGMGEPLHNYNNTLAAIDRLNDKNGLNIGARKITISTVGMVSAIRRYADEERQTPLAISLHAATNAERSNLIPVNKKWPIEDIIDACYYYIEKTGRRITFEWALISGQNDTIEQAQTLGRLVQGMLCHVNLIPLNPTTGFNGNPSSRERIDAFQQELEQYKVSSTVRLRRGIDIQAGCGQLRDRVVQAS